MLYAPPTAVFSLPEGTIIAGRYKLLKALGQGGFGITYVAWDSELRRQVAIKECFPVSLCMRDTQSGVLLPVSPEVEAPFLAVLNDMHREARTLAMLDHESIVKVHDVIWGNGSVFCVMTWLSGGTLRSRMSEESLMSREESLQILRYLLDALAYLHRNGIIHRDLKPENIMFNAEGRPVIIDFGAALNRLDRTTGAVTTQGAFSQSYASPEQITGKGQVGPWSDFYSLSVTWYELLTGVRPEKADARLMQDDLVPLTEVKCRIAYPAELLQLLQRNLSLHIGDRCKNVEQWLDCWKRGTLPPLDVPKPSRWREWRRNLLVAGAVVLMTGGGYALLQLAPRTPGAPAPAVDPAELGAELALKVRAACKVEEYVHHCEQYVADVHALEERQKEEQLAIISKYDALYKKAATRSELESIMREYDEVVRKSQDTCHKEQTELWDNFIRRIKPYDVSSTEAISQQYKPLDMNEAALLSQVAGAIFQNEAYPAFGKAQYAFSDLQSRLYSNEMEELRYHMNKRMFELINEG